MIEIHTHIIQLGILLLQLLLLLLLLLLQLLLLPPISQLLYVAATIRTGNAHPHLSRLYTLVYASLT